MSCRTASDGCRGGQGTQEEVDRGNVQLPTELVRAVIAQLQLDDMIESQAMPEAKAAAAMLRCLRLVSRAVKRDSEQLFPATRQDLRNRIVADFIWRQASLVHAVEMARSPEMEGVEEVTLASKWYASAGPQMHALSLDALNTLLEICSLRRFEVDLYHKSISLRGLETWRCATTMRYFALWHPHAYMDLATLDFAPLGALESVEIVSNELDMIRGRRLPVFPAQLRSLRLEGLGLRSAHITGLQLATRPLLQELLLGSNPLGRAGFAALEMEGNTTLVKLGLQNTEADDSCVELLHLGSNTVLKSLNLSVNQLTSTACLQLSTNATLSRLELNGNPLEDYDFGLEDNTSLKSLNLAWAAGNALSPMAFSSLSRQLARNKSLHKLDLSHSWLTGDSLGGFSVESAVGLRVLDLRGNLLDAADVRRLGIQGNAGLTQVLLGEGRTEVSMSAKEDWEQVARDLTTSTRKVEVWNGDNQIA